MVAEPLWDRHLQQTKTTPTKCCNEPPGKPQQTETFLFKPQPMKGRRWKVPQTEINGQRCCMLFYPITRGRGRSLTR